MISPRRPSTRVLLLLALLALGLTVLAGSATAQTRVGGPCRYDDFPGRATITAIAPLADPRPDQPYEAQVVTFAFAPDQAIVGERLYAPGKVYTLTLAGGRLPGPRFVASYGLRPGFRLSCRLRLLRQGTCTPVLFDFPDLDLTSSMDYGRP
jgi:hypothetical protein